MYSAGTSLCSVKCSQAPARCVAAGPGWTRVGRNYGKLITSSKSLKNYCITHTYTRQAKIK